LHLYIYGLNCGRIITLSKMSAMLGLVIALFGLAAGQPMFMESVFKANTSGAQV